MELLDLIRCPACAETLRWERRHSGEVNDEYGILECRCAAYPVVAGIPIMMRGAVEEVLAALRAERPERALLLALNTTPRSRLQGLVERLPVGRVPGLGPAVARSFERGRLVRAQAIRDAAARDASFRELLLAAFGYPGRPDTADYFFYKFGQPRYLAALAWIPALLEAEGPILDFGCGPGHFVWNLVSNGAAGRVVGADLYFKSLFLARRLAGRGARFVCCNADHGLPFRDGAFGAITSADTLHTLPYPAPCLRELRRSLAAGGLLALISVPNPGARCPVLRTGTPPAPERWSGLLDNLTFRLLCNRSIVLRYLDGQGPHAARSVTPEGLPDVPLTTVIASRNPRWFREYEAFERWPHACGVPVINPLYRPAEREAGAAGDGPSYCLTFPSQFFQAENGFAWTYLPETAELPATRPTAQQEDALLARWVVVGAPENYGAERYTAAAGDRFAAVPRRELEPAGPRAEGAMAVS